MNNPKAYIVELARSFPSLRAMVNSDPERWDVNRFLKYRNGASSGELHAIAFVAAVWNWNDDALPFNAVKAMRTWDSTHQSAFLSWVKDPQWP